MRHLTIGQDVTIDGAAGRTRCKLGALAISYAFSKGGTDYCFRDAIELKPQPRLPIGGALGHLTAAMPTQGDSGAWVLTCDATPVWAGVFFGEDGMRGFAIRSAWAHAWAEQVTGTTLRV
ncbi:hypothetical protein GV67_00040 [Pseudorhizobium pelagicum]|uniref:Uncharacterized protein n=1 Tax=Pseudorhizobium pelagicum TaxID=1509405 RepID=A0A922P1G6_9HYPH|nr:hypothetical protein GV68_02995 [Pseudorhizobium pelagicum]KEQ09116.1 hypothetical protein GV67_00040 [Pseudorhizobium pelagicum]